MVINPGKKCTKRITITGIVQGVGFRPFIYHLAVQYNIYGYVKNVSGSVEIMASGRIDSLNFFIESIISLAPRQAVINHLQQEDVPYYDADTFIIEESDDANQLLRLFPPDTGMCESCESEISDVHCRRFRHFFNNCVTCGPRYSILYSFPYDRKNTAMRDFALCHKCLDEYHDPNNIRFHAETISCADCGPTLFMKSNGTHYANDAALKEAVRVLIDGNILAIKGFGGFHYACLTTNPSAIEQLRKMKGREHKPFAVMFRSILEVQMICHTSEKSISLLTSLAKPIVLFPLTKHNFASNLLNGEQNCGCMLPYSPLHRMLMEHFDQLVMTSANISAEPIIHNDEEMLHRSEYVLYHNRNIIRCIEDSVVQAVNCDSMQVIRQSRGYSPFSICIPSENHDGILAMGSDLKASFSIYSNQMCTMSPYFGDLVNPKVLKLYQDTLQDWIAQIEVLPSLIAFDAHPAYITRDVAQYITSKYSADIIKIFHHHAHIASVIAENDLHSPLIGVAFDGSGYGTDDHMWGSEFFICKDNSYTRIAHLDYTVMTGLDASIKDAGIVAACYFNKYNFSSPILDNTVLHKSLLHRSHIYHSSSMGRLFDGICSIIGLSHFNYYEGQCAQVLQQHAELALKANIHPAYMRFHLQSSANGVIIMEDDIIQKAVYCAQGKFTILSFSLGFHIAVAEMVIDVCKIIRESDGISRVALSGGVFQNKLLLELCIERLKHSGFLVYFNTKVPPNDGGLALGQIYIATRSESYVYSDTYGNP